MRTKTGKRVRTKRAVKRPQRRRVGKANERKRLFSQLVLPLAICVAILICLGGLGYLGYQKVAASDFFDVKRIEVVGIQRASKEGIANVARMETERTGVWRSDLFELKSKIERIPFVKTASVTRVLPDGLRVQIVERQPVALVTRGGRDYLADADGEILALADHPEEGLPFTMIGWDETKSEKAMRDNTERVKIYQRMVGEWQAANVLSRVQNINLADLRERLLDDKAHVRLHGEARRRQSALHADHIVAVEAERVGEDQPALNASLLLAEEAVEDLLRIVLRRERHAVARKGERGGIQRPAGA